MGAQRGTRVRIYERTPGGSLYCAVWIPGQGASRRSLGHADRKQALQQAAELVALRGKGEALSSPAPLTLEALLARYLAECTHARDGSLKTERYRKDCAKRSKHLVKWFGERCEAASVTADRLQAYVQASRSGQISGRTVRTRSVQTDLVLLKGAFRWASGRFENGKPLLERNPLATFSVPRERDPHRPIIDASTVQALEAVAQAVNERLPLLLVLMDSTGRRISSVLGLRWDDLDLAKQTIRWRPELDKRRRSWLTPMPKRALEALQRFRSASPHIGPALHLPSARDESRPVSVYVAEAWLERAFKLAKVERPKGGLWHCFRRKWATERKTYPLRDVAAAGGWSDVQTLLTCYQQPDDDTLRAVVEREQLTHQLAQSR